MDKRAETLTFTQDHQPCVVEIANGRCNVKTFQLSMSRRHRMVMLVDLFTIGFIPAMTVWCATQFNSPNGIFISMLIGAIALVCGIGKTICDFANWLFSMNKMQEKIGEWYVEDITNIYNNIVKADCKVAAVEVSKVKEKNDKSDGKPNTPETKAEQGICA